ncbi:MAG: cache domain-containing protein, partial [Candidatus Sungiibacteriota bacterium]
MNRSSATFFSSQRIRDAVIHWIMPFAVAIFGLALVNLIWLFPVLGNIRASASVLALEISRRVETTIKTDLRTTLKEVQNAADEIALEPGRTRIVLDRLMNEYPNMIHIARVGRNGDELEEVERMSHESMTGISTMPAMHDAHAHVTHPHFYITLQGVANYEEVAVSPERGPHTMLVVPIRRNGKVEEALIADLNLDILVRAVSDITGIAGHFYIVDRNGVQVAHPDTAQIFQRKNFMARSIVQKVMVDGKIADGLAPEDSYINEQGERT